MQVTDSRNAFNDIIIKVVVGGGGFDNRTLEFRKSKPIDQKTDGILIQVC